MPGNSGGPLLDSAGRLVGVNTAIYSPSGGSSGIGFAVPVDTVRRVVPQLIEHGRVTRPSLGVSLVADATQRRLRLPGPMIAKVQPGTPAARAGLRGLSESRSGNIVLGDIVTHVDGARTPNGDALLGALEKHEVGDTVKLTIRRGASQTTVTVALASLN
ncbi:MAG: S1C family serine protease [Myxococcota bacterium]